MFCRPVFGLAELTWRWSFAFATGLLLAVASAEYLDTLPVSRADLIFLKTSYPALILHALAHIFHGSSARFVQSMVVIAVCLTALWIVTASLARAASVKALLTHFRSLQNSASPAEVASRWSFSSMFALHFFRAAALLAVVVASLSPFLILRASRQLASDGSSLLFIFAVVLLIGSAWSTVNWFLSLAALFVVSRGQHTFGAMGAAIDFCRDHPGPVFAVGTWFGLAHFGAFAIATFLSTFSVGLLGALPVGVSLAAILLVTLLYFGVADFLYIGRLAAYVAILELPDLPVAEAAQLTAIGPGRGPLVDNTPQAIDRDELILSDLPATT